MQVYLLCTEPALKRWGVSPCCCWSSGLGRWDSGAVRGVSCEVRAGMLCLFWSSLPLRLRCSGGLHSGQGETPDSTVVKLWLCVLTRGLRGNPYPSSMNETLLWLHALRTRL